MSIQLFTHNGALWAFTDSAEPTLTVHGAVFLKTEREKHLKGVDERATAWRLDVATCHREGFTFDAEPWEARRRAAPDPTPYAEVIRRLA